MSMRRADIISCTFWLVLSLVMAIESYLLDIGTFHAPESGFFPFVASIVLGSLSLTYLILTLRLRTKASGNSGDLIFGRQTWPKLLRISYVLISLFVYSLLLGTFGFILDTILLIGFLLIIGEQSWYVVVTGALSSSLLAYLLFDVILKCQLPKGFLGF